MPPQVGAGASVARASIGVGVDRLLSVSCDGFLQCWLLLYPRMLRLLVLPPCRI